MTKKPEPKHRAGPKLPLLPEDQRIEPAARIIKDAASKPIDDDHRLEKRIELAIYFVERAREWSWGPTTKNEWEATERLNAALEELKKAARNFVNQMLNKQKVDLRDMKLEKQEAELEAMKWASIAEKSLRLKSLRLAVEQAEAALATRRGWVETFLHGCFPDEREIVKWHIYWQLLCFPPDGRNIDEKEWIKQFNEKWINKWGEPWPLDTPLPGKRPGKLTKLDWAKAQAARQAAVLCKQYGIINPRTGKPAAGRTSPYCKLAAVLHGTPKLGMKEICQRALKDRREGHGRPVTKGL